MWLCSTIAKGRTHSSHVMARLSGIWAMKSSSRWMNAWLWRWQISAQEGYQMFALFWWCSLFRMLSSCPRLPDSATSQRTRLLAGLDPSPNLSLFCMVTKQTERACLDNPACAPVPDALPQLQTKSVCPAQSLSCRLFSICKLCNWHIDICMWRHQGYVCCSLTVAKTHTTTQHEIRR